MGQKVKSQNYSTLRKILKGKFQIKCQNKKLELIKRMDKNCHFPDLV